MKLIKDLGSRLYCGRNVKYGLFECEYCQCHFETQTARAKRTNQKRCSACKSIKHDESSNGQTRLYKILANMKQRCYNENNPSYVDYGANEIEVCDEWKNSFESFREWAMSNGYEDNLKIDRIENDGNYEPINCRWTTQNIQSQNTRMLQTNNTSGFRGVEKSGSRWRARIHNVSSVNLGTFDTKEDAARAYNEYVVSNDTKHTLNII